VDIGWLRAAVAVAPVDAEVSAAEGTLGSVLAIFPGPEHAGVVPETLSLAAGEECEIVCGKGLLRITKDGRVVLRGRDVTTRGLRVNRIQGGVVKIN
jgi:hypothetical protein